MSAEVLRRAAALMRERAEVCGKDPRDESAVRWIYTRATPEALKPFPAGDLPDGVLIRSYQYREPVQEGDWIIATHWEEDGEYIASWSPPVAVEVATWLDETADHLDIKTNQYADGSVCLAVDAAAADCSIFQAALNVARAYLGEVTP